MEKLHLRDEIIDLLREGWGEPLDGRRLPRSLRLLKFYRRAMELPLKNRPSPASTVYGFNSVRVKKNTALCRWDVYGVNTGGTEAVLVCSVHWRLAFDDSEVWDMDNAGDVIAALQACIAFSPLTQADVVDLRKKIPQLPFGQTKHDTSRWVIAPQDTAATEKNVETSPLARELQESEFCLKRQISLD